MKIGTILTGEQRKTEEILSLFAPQEGTIAFYYGKVRNGKTYTATADILGLLARGEVVLANYHVSFDGLDERQFFGIALLKFLFGKRYFFNYHKENFHYFDPTTPAHEIVRKLNKLVGVHIFIDEGQWILNSHNRNPDPEAQALVLTNGHFCRSLNMISQRPSNVFKDYRSQVHFWYKCEKKLTFPWLIFQKTIIEDMKDDMPDEESESNKVQVYFANKSVYQAYNRWAFRGVDAVEYTSNYDVYETTFLQRLLLLCSFLVPQRFLKAGQRLTAPRRKDASTGHLEPFEKMRSIRDIEIRKTRLDKEIT